ncbi:MAG: hypothetical protein JNL75_08605 [Chitinophagales bacterium]|nr:hypothetical protein [Chitinophagales bacterium]
MNYNKKAKRKALCLNSAENLDSNYVNQVKWNVPKVLTLYIPENLDIDKILSEKPPNFKHHRDCFIYLISLINDIPSRNKELISEFTQFYSPLVQRRIKDYRLYLDYLIENKIIETDNHYIKDTGKSKGYGYHLNYETKVKPIEITKYTLIKSILKFIDLDNTEIESENNGDSIINKELPYITKWLNKNLTIDFEGASTYLLNEYKKDLKNKVKKRIANRKFCSRMIVIHKLHRGDFQYSIDNNAGRLYTVLTQIKKELRQFIRYNGKNLVAIDIKNSQPYLSSILFSKFHFDLNNCENIIKYYNPIFRNDNNYTNFENKLVELGEKQDTKDFLEIISNGLIYEYFGCALQNHSLIDLDLDPKIVRKKAKKILISLLFSKNDYWHFQGYTNVLKTTFPSIFEAYYLLKYEKHNSLACFLQNLEAKLVLHKACKIISEENPDLLILTIHDSIVTTEGNEEYVKGILSKVLHENIGLPPTLEVEKWKKSLLS